MRLVRAQVRKRLAGSKLGSSQGPRALGGRLRFNQMVQCLALLIGHQVFHLHCLARGTFMRLGANG